MEKVVTSLIIAILIVGACLAWDIAHQPDDTYLKNYYLQQAHGPYPSEASHSDFGK